MTTDALPRVLPKTAAELEDTLADPAKVDKIVKAGQLGQLIEEYTKSRISQQVSETVATETQRALVNYLRAHEPDQVRRVNLDAPNRAERRAGAAYNRRAIGAKIDDVFAEPGDFWSAISWPNLQAGINADKIERIRAAYTETTGEGGGFLVPEVLRSELLRLSLESAIVRPRARVIPMSSLTLPIPRVKSTSNVSSIHGGMVAYWTEEGGALTEAAATYARLVLQARKLTAYSVVPNELPQDAMAIASWLQDSLPEVISWEEDNAFLRGDGVGKPLGHLSSHGGVVAVAAEGGQLAGTILWQNIVKMFARMLPSSMGRAVWVCAIDTFPELATMALSVGTGGSAIWLNNGASGPPMTILGRPVLFTEKVPTAGTQGDVSFVDFGQYVIGDRMAMTAQSSADYRFGTDETAYRVITRVDGQPMLDSAITPKNGGDDLAAVVQIATRS